MRIPKINQWKQKKGHTEEEEGESRGGHKALTVLVWCLHNFWKGPWASHNFCHYITCVLCQYYTDYLCISYWHWQQSLVVQTLVSTIASSFLFFSFTLLDFSRRVSRNRRALGRQKTTTTKMKHISVVSIITLASYSLFLILYNIQQVNLLITIKLFRNKFVSYKHIYISI